MRFVVMCALALSISQTAFANGVEPDEDTPAIAPGFSIESADDVSIQREEPEDARLVKVATRNSSRYLSRDKDADKDPAVKAKKASHSIIVEEPVTEVLR